MATSDDILDNITDYSRNPALVLKNALELYETITNGETVVVDSSNPFVFALEMSAVQSANSTLQAEAATRRLFPSMAQGQDELYYHMADEDYLNRFAVPATSVVGFVFPLSDVLSRAVDINDGTGARALIIPRHTAITIGSYTFTTQYPIVIKVQYNGNLSIYMDTTVTTPTYIPTSNSLRWTKSQFSNNDWLLVEVPVQQVKITSVTQHVISFTGFSHTFTFSDSFYYARAYTQNTTGGWDEISVTHQGTIYSAMKPTVCLTVLNSSVSMYIPQIYFQNGLITGTVRLDIYTTKGALNVDLTDVASTTTQIKWQDLDRNLTKFSTPLNNFTAVTCIPRKKITGGRSALPFNTLAKRVIERSSNTEPLPITTNELTTLLNDTGFGLISKLDNITDLYIAATKQVEAPTDTSTVTGLGCSMQTVRISPQTVGVSQSTFLSNGRATISPNHLFTQSDQGVVVLSNAQIQTLRQTAINSPETIVNTVNGTQYYYTPFHYVLDLSGSYLNVRPYYLSSPTIDQQYLYQQNDTLGLDLRLDSYGLTYNSDHSGYQLLVTLNSNASLQALNADQVTLQLSYLVSQTTSRGHILGKLITPVDAVTEQPSNNVWAYQFIIPTTWDIDVNDQIDNSSNNYRFGLTQMFDLTMVVKDYQPTGSVKTDIDVIVSTEHIDGYNPASTYIGASQERLSVTFGQSLPHLWRRSRAVVEPTTYQTYAQDVLAYYSKDIYELDDSGSQKLYLTDSGAVEYNVIHKQGDPILTEGGKHVVLHARGSVIKDVFGVPIPLNNDFNLIQLIDLFLVDGCYYFATADATTDYLKTSLDTIAGWITNDMANLDRRLSGATELYFYPKASVGEVDVIVGEGRMVQLPAGQTFNVVYTLSKENNANAELKEQLISTTPKVLMQALTSLESTGDGTLTKNDLIGVVKTVMGNDIIDVDISGFLGDNYTAVLLTDVSSVPTIGKRLVTLSNLTLQVQDAVDVTFKQLSSNGINKYTLGK